MPYARASITLVALAASSLVLAGAGQPPAAKPAPTPAPAASAVSAKIASAAFLAGNWTGAMGKSFVQEMWSAPEGKSVIGAFRWMKEDGTPSMIEMLSITEEEGTLRLRMRHHNAALIGWEEKDKPVVMKLASSNENSLVFASEKDCGDLASVTYTRSAEALAIDVEFVKGEKPRSPLNFKLTRAKQ